MDDFNSYHWHGDIIKLISKFYEIIKKDPGGKYVKLDDDAINDLFKKYQEYLTQLKEVTTRCHPEIKSKHLIDHHKIVALYIKSIIKVKPFTLLTFPLTEKITLRAKLPNEALCFSIMKLIFKGWKKQTDNIDNYCLKIPQQYQENFIKLLYLYRNKADELPVFALSHIIYLIELTNDSLFYDKSSKYFKHIK